MSVLLRPSMAPERAGVLTAAVGLAARQACIDVVGVTPALKWPNDLVAVTDGGERKLGGVLAESRVIAGRVDAVVIGLGLNVAWPERGSADLGDLADIAVSLNHLRPDGASPDRVELVEALLRDLELRLRIVEADDDRAVWASWKDATSTLGRHVRVETSNGDLVGEAVDITDRGRLVVEAADGERTEVDVGDVVHLRPIDR